MFVINQVLDHEAGWTGKVHALEIGDYIMFGPSQNPEDYLLIEAPHGSIFCRERAHLTPSVRTWDEVLRDEVKEWVDSAVVQYVFGLAERGTPIEVVGIPSDDECIIAIYEQRQLDYTPATPFDIAFYRELTERYNQAMVRVKENI